jgi:hypothetical protein
LEFATCAVSSVILPGRYVTFRQAIGTGLVGGQTLSRVWVLRRFCVALAVRLERPRPFH